MTHASPGTGEKFRSRLYGIVFIVVCVVFVVACLAFYQRAFTPVVKVRFMSDRAGLQLLEHSDVKIRGLIVGEVRKISVTDEGAVMDLAIQKDKAGFIPANATGRLLPKTLFGEKYIDLAPPAQPSQPIRDGVVLHQDKSAESIEIDQVLNNLMPLLQAVQPEKLNATLTAVATALEGRGDQLGENLEQLDRLLGKVNPELNTLVHDIKALGDVSDIYADATPDLVRVLKNINVTSTTIVEKEEAIEALIPAVTSTAEKANRFMLDNGNKIIGVNLATKDVVKLLATYAPQFPCVLDGMSIMIPRANEAFGNGTKPMSSLYVEIVKPRPAYKNPLERVEFNDYRKPRCYGLPNPKVPFPDYVALDGTEDNVWWKKRGISSLFVQPGADTSQNEAVKSIVAPVLRQDSSDVPDFATLLFGPLATGSVVTIK
ncbi:MCE family protein [Actinocorallia sp. B10E7]|uniref:MCE family protein n=1 Tax=Actinocorallia sp. B10E7 TaxID=3153558 RepID=UPI00325D7527